MVKTSLHIALPVEWYWNGCVVGDRLGIGVYHMSHRDTCHERQMLVFTCVECARPVEVQESCL